jgi:murein DD-endopeptidase MepM/ murein hydrolase activator NlpD
MDEFTNMEQLIENGFYIVSGLLTTIAGISGVQSLSSLAKTAGGSKFLGGMSGLKSAGLIGATVYSVGSMVHDASAMQGSTGKGAGWDATRGVFLGTGSSEKSTGENAKSVLGNTAKWAAAGAVIGSVIPGLGTVAGGIIGGVAGLGAGLFGANQENKKAQKEQQEALDKITENTKTTAEQTKLLNNNVSNRGYVSAVAMGGDEYGYSTGKTYSHTPKPSLPWGSITSWYGTRTNPITGAKGSFHSGIDIGAKAGTSIGAAYNGTVVGKGHNSSMGNWISVKDDNGKTHTYMHMISGALPEVGDYVSQGQVVGYVGSTGASTGPHLHYSVNTGTGYNRTTTIDPYEYMLNSGIFGGTTVSASLSSSSSSSGRSSMMDKVSQLIQMDAIGGDNGNPVVNSIQDLKQTIIDLSNRTTANEKLMKSIAGTYVRSPRVG